MAVFLEADIMALINTEERICKQLQDLELSKEKPFYQFIKEKLDEQLAAARHDAAQAFKSAIKVDERQAYRAVLRIAYKDRLAGNVNINDGKSKERRGVPEPNGGVSGIRRHRTVSGRTAQLLSYTGTSAGFLLRFINSQTDVRTAHADVHGKGTKSTWGRRGVSPKSGRTGILESAVRMDSRAEEIANSIHDWLINNALESNG